MISRENERRWGLFMAYKYNNGIYYMCFLSFLFSFWFEEKKNREILEPLLFVPEDIKIEDIYNKPFRSNYSTIVDVVDERINKGLDRTTTVEEYEYLFRKNNLIWKKIQADREKLEI
jgi:hypothetical protein